MEYLGKNTIYDYITDNNIPDGIHSMRLANDEVIDFEIINFTEDKIFDGKDILGNDTPDTTMLIVKCHKSCKIYKDVIVTPQVRKKGFVLYVNNDLTNNGIISMTARGANAEGQDVIIYGKSSEYHIIPAIGGSGGIGVGNSSGVFDGLNGENGTNNSTGGGGSGAYYSNRTFTSGAGSAGTSYSGGSGGGAVACYDGGSSAFDAEINGGAGGQSICRRTSSNNWNATGGIGNPSGLNAYRTSSSGVSNTTTYPTSQGTGGLLIIYCNNLINNNIIESCGSDSELNTIAPTKCSPGGASGGGSINIFSNILTSRGTIIANGGKSATGRVTSGCGGNGSVSLLLSITIDDEKLISSSSLIYILTNTYRNISKMLKTSITGILSKIKNIEEQISVLSTGKIWGEAVETIESLPEEPLESETHLVLSENNIYSWNGTKWVVTGANVIPLASETLDGQMSKDDKIKLNSINMNDLASIKESMKIYSFVVNTDDFILDENTGLYKKNIVHNLKCSSNIIVTFINSNNELCNMSCSIKNIKLNSFDIYSITNDKLIVNIGAMCRNE